MLKIFGSLLLLVGSAGIGLLHVKHMDKRIQTLRSLQCALEIMEREISFRVPLLEEMLTAAAQSTEDTTRRFFAMCMNELKKDLNDPFYEIWIRAAREKLTTLKESDLDHIFALGSVLGRYGTEEQRLAIARVHTTLEQVLSAAVDERHRHGKLYGVLGTTAGAFLVILLQ